MRTSFVVAFACALAVGSARAQQVGLGTGKSATTAPVTKSAGTAAERAELRGRELAVGPGSGLSGPGSPEAWRAGDRVRSATSADVRAARVQEAPDLEWAGEGAAARAAAEPYGKRFQKEQEGKRP